MNMKEDFVSYNIAVKLKEKGFEWDCYTTFDGIGYTTHFCPTIAQVLKWLRECKKIHFVIDMREKVWFFDLRCLKTGYIMDCTMLGFSDTYEQAALAGIEYVIDNLI